MEGQFLQLLSLDILCFHFFLSEGYTYIPHSDTY